MSRWTRTEVPTAQLRPRSVKIRPQYEAQLDRWAAYVATKFGVPRSRGRALEYLLDQQGEPPS